jgi:hypothetical protein
MLDGDLVVAQAAAKVFDTIKKPSRRINTEKKKETRNERNCCE